jgi:hypothetical protein
LLTDDLPLHRLVLILVSNLWHLHTPLEISRHSTRSQSLSQHPRLHDLTFGGDDGVVAPPALCLCFPQPLLETGLEDVESQARVGRGTDRDGVVLVALAARVEERGRRREGEGALVALVSSGILVESEGSQNSRRTRSWGKYPPRIGPPRTACHPRNRSGLKSPAGRARWCANSYRSPA